ncbi:MAG: family 20 glycosylhydrolase [Bacteroidetes bacterium]|nr:family 20 glycosylhydrolase [Bacteroidota bacterium]
MKKNIFLITLFISIKLLAQPVLPNYADSLFPTYYWQRATLFQTLPKRNTDIVFLGNSITDGAEWSEIFNDIKIKNRGISGDISAGVIKRLPDMVAGKPAKIFLLIGVNDISRGISVDSIFTNISLIANYIHYYSSNTKLYVQSILPVSDFYKKFGTHTNKFNVINQLNSLLKNNAEKLNYTFINLHDFFADENGKMNVTLTNDGLHLKGDGYMLWKHIVFPYVYNVEKKPALIPYPKQITWNEKLFPFYKVKNVVVNNEALLKLNINEVLNKNFETQLNKNFNDALPIIKINLANVNAPLLKDEAYQIHIDANALIVNANSVKAAYYALQTIKQLTRDNTYLDGCDITDSPSFEWRGYMTDAGRNYQTVKFLKQQIDVMSNYKMNIFHFHITEDLAWRWQIKKYPQLTNAENMLRDKGMFYSIDDIKELIKYCNDRFITLVPELDMPGHSAAFTKAMGHNMQSEEGKKIIADILNEIFATYNFPYFHIGADEVKITDTAFIPYVQKIIEAHHAQVIGWKPGGNFNNKTFLQLWNGDEKLKNGFKYIDSRHLYLNHFDPFESVVTIFARKICDVNEETNEAKGAEICLWHDRRVQNENDLIEMNAVYPAMLAFSEKIWNGGGDGGFITNISQMSDNNKKLFEIFENRLLEHKQLYFQHTSFPYYKQSNTIWKLVGPFYNHGNLADKFHLDTLTFDKLYQSATQTEIGNTIVLRHWWNPMVTGVLKHPEENTTWYALQKMWSDADTIQPFWIGFNNISRSTATTVPELNTWDDKQSSIWINGNKIKPPVWFNANQKIDLETPLTNEGYEFRTPTFVSLKKGWNEILVKLPVASFKGKNWENPVKWMFTVVPVKNN